MRKTFARVLIGAGLCAVVACVYAEWKARTGECALGMIRFTDTGGVQICAPR